TTDHISPAGAIKPDSPAGKYLIEHGVERNAFNSYGARRGNHAVMVRGTFANVRLRHKPVPEPEGTRTVHAPARRPTASYHAPRREGVPGARASRHPARARVPAARRHPPVRPAPAPRPVAPRERIRGRYVRATRIVSERQRAVPPPPVRRETPGFAWSSAAFG